nr:hypothetical protein [Tanacetum cinerariifolium]
MAPRRTTRSTADQETVNATMVTNVQLQTMINQGVTAALAARDALRSTNGDDSHNSRTGVRRTERAARECTYINFLKCQPLPFKGTEGVASLLQWCERMESVFHISNCATENQVKFATCTLHSVALTWWNTHVQTIRKLEMKLWELKIKGTDLASYTQRFQELALLFGRMFSEESDKVEKYVEGLPDMIHGSVVASKSKTMQKAIEIATEIMDKKIRTFAERETASKRKFKNTSRTTRNQQQQHSNKRQNTDRVYTAASGRKKQYTGSKPLCAKCNYHHDGPCAPKCHNINKISHSASDCRSVANTNNANNQRGTKLGHKPTCYECGVRGHFRRECPKLEIARSLRHYKSEYPIVKFHKRVDMIHERVRASKPKTMLDAIEIATKLMNKKTSTLAECQTKNKKRLDNTSKNNQNQQQPNKRQNAGRAYTTRHGEKKHYGGSKPLCSKCNYHHDGPCAPKCHRNPTCYERGNQGHYRSDCPELKNQDHGNQAGDQSEEVTIDLKDRNIDENANCGKKHGRRNDG